MRKSDDILRDICQREIVNSLYDIKINDISIYNYIKRSCRDKVMSLYDQGENISAPQVPPKESRKSFLLSIFKLLKYLLLMKKAENLIIAFERTDMIGGVYVDKFTDPLIDFTNIGNSYFIFEQGRAGRHLSPRLHANKVIFTDCIYRISYHLLPITRKYYIKKNYKQLKRLYASIKQYFPEITIEEEWMINVIISKHISNHIFSFLFRRLGIKRIFAPSRGSFFHLIPAAKKRGIIVYELQHGITYSESLTYSGYIDPLFSPDYFLSFGKIDSAWCYGISDDKVVEIGWAFEKYIQKQEKTNNKAQKVLVISSPSISERMVSITCKLALQNHNIFFYFRPHPNEQLDKNQYERLYALRNITIDNSLENVTVSLMRFDNVIGENSTVLYEALSMGKKVGKLCMEGLEPQYLKREDMACFYEIANNSDFVEFINAPLEEKPSMKIYTPFKPEVVNNLLQ